MKSLCALLAVLVLCATPVHAQDGWIPLFDGRTMNGWQPSENKDSWKVEDGMLVTRGPRSHLFYMGDVQNHNFKNFELSAEVRTMPNSNSGIYIHTEYQETGWPSKGYECQVFSTFMPLDTEGYAERKMTGSIYAIRNTWKSPVPDNAWFTYRIVLQGKTIRTYIDDNLICEYTEPERAYRRPDMTGRLLSSGTFALQCHDPGSVVYYRNIRVRPLPDDLPTPGTPPEDPAFERKLINLAAGNLPLIDLHTHIKGGLTMEAALENARRYGFTYGTAINCGLDMEYPTEEALEEFIDNYDKPPQTWIAMQAEGREWMDIFKPETVAKFDYVFTDAMTWTNDDGRRMRLWMPNEVVVGDPQDFMEQLVTRIEDILNNEPIDIHVNPTYLPAVIADQYDALWTPERMDRVIRALVDNHVALEINSRFKIPSATFIKRAKAAGVKFTLGTNNAGANDLGRLEYSIDMINECGLTDKDMWIPDGEK